MSKIFQLEGGQYEHPNEYKLVRTVRGTTILQPEFGTVIIEGDVIEASTPQYYTEKRSFSFKSKCYNGVY